MRRDLGRWVVRDPQAEVLVVTNGWPNEDDPAYCIFVKRQMTDVRQTGVRADVFFIRGDRSTWAYPLAVLSMLRLNFSARRYRLVHAHGGEAVLAARFYLRAPLVASYLGDDLLGRADRNGDFPVASRVKRFVIRQHARLAGGVITKSVEMKSALPATVRQSARVIPNGVDTLRFQPLHRDVARDHLGWGPEPVVLVVANLRTAAQAARKRVWLAEEAMPYVRAIFPDARLVVASGLEPDSVPLYMNAADVLVLSSSVEGSPNVVKEALMCNLPVVATDAGDVRELLAGVHPSFVVDPSPQAIADGVLGCLQAGERSNGREINAHLSSTAITTRILELYRDVAPAELG